MSLRNQDPTAAALAMLEHVDKGDTIVISHEQVQEAITVYIGNKTPIFGNIHSVDLMAFEKAVKESFVYDKKTESAGVIGWPMETRTTYKLRAKRLLTVDR